MSDTTQVGAPESTLKIRTKFFYGVGASAATSNFINFVRARGPVAWVCTDDGLTAFDGETWVTYRADPETGRGEILITEGETRISRTSASTIAHNYVLGVDFEDDRVWVATADGLSLGVAPRDVATLMPR